LQNPVIGLDKKAAVLHELGTRAKAPPVVEKFLAHVVRKNRISLLAEIAEAFARLADQASNRKVVHLSSARPLTDSSRADIEQKLAAATRGAIELTTDVNPGLLGGLKIRIGSTVYDGSIRGQIERMRTALSKEV
jgi:F-type H+-transporting ATPase subunit delta